MWNVKRETRVSRGALALLGTRRVSACQGWAGETSGLFEHPADYSDTITLRIITAVRRTKIEFFSKLLMGKIKRSCSWACLLPQWEFPPCR
jgi:hypothetical protein